MKDLVKVIQEESYTYRDPITSFIEDLYVNFDFKGAQQKLRECETVLFFLRTSDNECAPRPPASSVSFRKEKDRMS